MREHIAPGTRCLGWKGRGAVRLADRHRLAREKRFVETEALGFDDPAIGGDAVALGEDDQVAANHLASRNSPAYPVAHDDGARAGQIAQRFERPFASRLLENGDSDRKPREACEDQRLAQIAEREINGAARDEQRQHRLAQDIEQYSSRRPPSVARKLVGAVRGEPCPRLGFAQPPEWFAGGR